MAPFEELYGRRSRSLIEWYEVGETRLFEPDLIGGVAYELELPANLGSVHPVSHISILKKFIGYHSLVLPVEEIKVNDSLTYEEKPVAILDRQVRKLRSKEIASVKVLWRNQKVEEATWESENDMRVSYPSLFDSANGEMEGTILVLYILFYI
ncbi:uncharacterized protein LOC124898098 [Capsicum annuum]|uniref:uncharacterized protein LOC124898098 n=1 Tax=Capsicum annuum TaxID=4072 RepID=UPI001FB12F06|nr:uncharacterized protein LOC124898098 [Capsicum annuum]